MHRRERERTETKCLPIMQATDIMPGMKTKPLSEQLRRAVLASELSRYQIWKRTGIAQSVLSRFVAGTVGISLETVDLLAECIGARLVVDRKPSRRKGK